MDLQESEQALRRIREIESLLNETKKTILRSTQFTLNDLERELEQSNAIQLELTLHPKDKKIAEEAFLTYHNTIKRLLTMILDIKSALANRKEGKGKSCSN